MIALSVDPDPFMAAEKPAEIDSTDTNTMTTPAIPMMATVEEPSRAGIVRKLRNSTATVCRIQFMAGLLTFFSALR